jgi:histidinol-phosphate aminotransferase
VLQRAGFALDRVDFDAGDRAAFNAATGLQVVAKPLLMPADSLAVSAWGTPPRTRVELDLRYSPDEAELLDLRPAEVWREIVANGAGDPSHYAVDDPFGAHRGAPTVSAFFGCDFDTEQVTFAAGVTSLLHHLCGLADDGVIVSAPLAHGDLEAWALARGFRVQVLPSGNSPEGLEDFLETTRPALFHLDRPGFIGDIASLGEVERLARMAARTDTVVVIDESALTYLGPAASAANLANRVSNLVVLRGFTKAYSWGGLRAGYAVASRPLARHVRELVSPLEVSEQSLAAALRILAAGDVFETIRRRIHALKPRAADALERAGFSPLPSHPDLPWIALSDRRGTPSEMLMRRGIRSLSPAHHPAVDNPPEVIRIMVPLSDDRHALMLALLDA